MHEFRGADDLSFTAAEQEAIARAAAHQPAAVPVPVPVGRAWRWPYAAGGTIAAVLFLWTVAMIDSDKGQGEKSSRPVATVAIARKAVHLREQPDVGARSVAIIPAGDLLTVDERRAAGFDRVLHRNRRGYAARVYLAVTEGVELVSNTETRVTAITGRARLREQPTLQAAPIAALEALAPVTVMGITPSGWCLVWTGSRAAFLWGGLLEDHPSLPFRARQHGGERVVSYHGKVLRP